MSWDTDWINPTSTPMTLLIALLSGLIFGLGLITSGMSDPAKVLSFLDLGGRWDPSLAFVMAGAIGAARLPFAWALRQPRSWLGQPMPSAPARTIDRSLILGSALFGVGWGLSGFCPGPAITSAGAFALPGIIFTAAMVTGMKVFDWRNK